MDLYVRSTYIYIYILYYKNLSVRVLYGNRSTAVLEVCYEGLVRGL